MNVYEVKFANNDKTTEVEADSYKIEEGFLTFSIFNVNIVSVDSSHIETVRLERRLDMDEQEFEEIRNKFKTEYAK